MLMRDKNRASAYFKEKTFFPFDISLLKTVGQAVISLLIFVFIWHFGVKFSGWSPYVLPPPLDVADTFVRMANSGVIFEHLFASLYRLTLGAAVAFLIAVPLGFGIALSPTVRFFFGPITTVMQPIPGIAWIPLAILWFGLGPAAVGFIILLAAFFPILFATIAGVHSVNPQLVRAAKVMMCSKSMIIKDVIVPGALPFIITGVRIGIGFAWRALVAGEMIAATSGLGFMIFDARNYLRTDEVIVGMLTIGIFWTAIEGMVLRTVEAKTITRWGLSQKNA